MGDDLKTSVAAGLRHRAARLPVLLVLVSTATVVLAGCGQKGPLILPPAAAASAPAR